ncbi:KH domain-containing protein [Micractinium conductrix]|uniref:KH domain-containing protein n=1 Tax=Micractinium conductrix TaxID=554055 RepID=A0A2P6VBL2_9CHLO|nr:KH domain-containing protein [Micractinium conductrix]|eukprot:PSC71475.1 KH domain-containing protein [Micractinium conductrix]
MQQPMAAGPGYPAPAAAPGYVAPQQAPVLPPPGAASAAPANGAAVLAGNKRSLDDAGVADGVKRQQLAHVGAHAVPAMAPATPAAVVPRETVYRLVLDLPEGQIVIGRGGMTVREIEGASGGRVKRMSEPPGCQQQTLVVFGSSRDLPSPGRATRNAAQNAVLECARWMLQPAGASPDQPGRLRVLINRSQEAGVVQNLGSIQIAAPGVQVALRRGTELPACALDNDVLVELSGPSSTVLAALEPLSHVLREHPVLERPGGPPPVMLAMAAQRAGPGGPPLASAPPAGPPPMLAAGGPGYGAPPAYRPY